MALWELPDYTTLRQFIIETVSQVRTALGTAPDTGPGSDVDVDATTLATIEQRLHRYVRLGIAMLFPQSASGEGSKGWAIEMGLSDGQGGYGPVLPDVASATDGLSCTSTGATLDIQNLTLLDEAGLQYKVNESYSFPSATTTAVDIISVNTGLATNLPVGSTLSFESPIGNLNEDATIVVELEGGVDAEEDPSINSRVLSRWRDPSLSGNNVHWLRWIEETDEGVFDGWVWPRRYGYDPGPPITYGVLGTVDYAATLRGFSREDRIISAPQVAAITAHIDESVPIDLMKNSRQLTLTKQNVSAEAEIELHPGADSSSSPDFDSHTLDASVSTWTASVGATPGWVRCDKAINTVITGGDYVLIGNARARVGLVGVGSQGNTTADFNVDWDFDDATPDDEPDGNPYPWPAGYDPTAAPDRVISGGGVIETAVAAGITYFDSLGPCRGPYPASDFTDWDDTYRYKLLQSAVQRSADDILDVTVKAFGGGVAADVEPVDPGGATTVLLTAGSLVIEVIP